MQSITQDELFLQIEAEFSEFRLQTNPELVQILQPHLQSKQFLQKRWINIQNNEQQKQKSFQFLDDNSYNYFQLNYDTCQQYLTRLENEIKQQKLSKENKLNFDILKSLLTSYTENFQFQAFLCPLNGFEGPQASIVDTINNQVLENELDLVNYAKLLQEIPLQLQQNIDILQRGIQEQITSPKVTLKGVLEMIDSLFVGIAPEKSVFFGKVQSFLDENKQQTEKFRVQVENIKYQIQEEIYGSLKKLSEFVKNEYIPKCRDSIACKSLKNGEQMYKNLIKCHTTTDYTPQQIHDMGKKEVSNIKTRMENLMKNILEKNSSFFSNAEESAKITNLREFQDIYLEKNPAYFHSIRENLLQNHVKVCKNLEEKIKDFFEVETSELIPYQIQEVAKNQEDTAPAAFYLFKSGKGYYYVNAGNLKQNPIYEIKALASHEAIPGHHYQQAILEKQKSLPQCRTVFEDRKYYQFPSRYPFFTGYLEGWGLYCEFLGEEMGLYETDEDLFGRLSLEQLRACRLVVDTGMHYFNWTFEQAVNFMMENSAIEKPSIEAEVSRYIQWPGQAVAYKVGEIKIKEMRQKAKDQLKEKFCIKKFHSIVLENGPIPLNLVEQLIQDWIQENQ